MILNSIQNVSEAAVMLPFVIPLGQFIQERLYLCGLKTQRSVRDKTGVSLQTINNLFKATDEADVAGMQFGTQAAIAEACSFSLWRELIAAWKQDGIRIGLPPDWAIKQAVANREPPAPSAPTPLESALAANDYGAVLDALDALGVDRAKLREAMNRMSINAQEPHASARAAMKRGKGRDNPIK